MVGLIVMDNAVLLIILFEMMSLASWFLVIVTRDDESIHAGLPLLLYRSRRLRANPW